MVAQRARMSSADAVPEAVTAPTRELDPDGVPASGRSLGRRVDPGWPVSIGSTSRRRRDDISRRSDALVAQRAAIVTWRTYPLGRYISVVADIAEELDEAEVYEVVFVRDYVQFGLHVGERNVRITAVVDPEVVEAGRRFSRSQPGWRDALCDLINAHVRVASISEAAFRVEFDTGAILQVSLRDADRVFGPEAVHVVGRETWIL